MFQYICLFSSWTSDEVDYSDPIPEKHIFSEKQTSHFNPTGNRAYIYDSFFQVTYRSNGGAISYAGGEMLIELSTFYHCKCGMYGGAIYQTNGNCIVYKCCGVHCFSDFKWGKRTVYMH